MLNSKCFEFTKMLYKYIFGKVKKEKRKKETNAGRNFIVLEEDKLSSLLPLVSLRDIHRLVAEL